MSRRRPPLPVPAWQTPMPPTAVDSWGPDVEAWARRQLGLVFDRWQRDAIDRALAVDVDGRLVHRVYLVSTGRQNGKSAIVRAVVGWALTSLHGPSWQTIIGVAYDKRQARRPYDAVRVDLEPMARQLGPSLAGGLDLTRYFGIRSGVGGRPRLYDIASKDAPRALRGESLDLGVFDEVREQRTYELWAALEPTTRARPEPLILATSSAGDDRSVLLRFLFDRGRRIIEGIEPAAGFGMTWYAPAEDVDPTDPAGWTLANPSIVDGRLDPARIAEALANSTPEVFRMESLNLWAETAIDASLPPGAWQAIELVDAVTVPTPAPVLAVDMTPRRGHASIAVAGPAADGRTVVGLAAEVAPAPDEEAVTMPQLREAVRVQVAAWRPSEVVYDARASAAPAVAEVCDELDLPGRAVQAGELRAACDRWYGAVVGRELVHPVDPLLTAQLGAARRDLTGDGWRYSRRRSDGDIDAVIACVLAVWGRLRPIERPAVPQVFV